MTPSKLFSRVGEAGPSGAHEATQATVIFGQRTPLSLKVPLLQGKGHCHDTLRLEGVTLPTHTTQQLLKWTHLKWAFNKP